MPKKTKPQGATYPLRELAALASSSARTWATYRDQSTTRHRARYGADALVGLFKAIALVLDYMADDEQQTDPPPPKASLFTLKT